MNPIDAAWSVLKALPGDEIVQNRYRLTRQGNPFLDEKGNPTPETKRDLVEQMRLRTRHPALNPAHVIESVSGRPTNIKGGSHLSPIEPTDILRYPDGFNITGAETGRADAERVHEQRMNEESQRRLTGNTSPPRLIDKHRYTHETTFPSNFPTLPSHPRTPPRYYGGNLPRTMGGLSDEEFENLRQQAQQMPFSYEGQ